MAIWLMGSGSIALLSRMIEPVPQPVARAGAYVVLSRQATTSSVDMHAPPGHHPPTLSVQQHPLLQGAVIDRESPVPFYFQLAALLEQEIVSGRWAPGHRLPSEPEIARRFGLSRTTIRQALGRLEQEGLITRRKGHGTFVAETRPRSWLLQSSGGFFQDEVERLGRSVTSVVRRTIAGGALPPWAAAALGLAEREGGTLERVRSIDGLVAMVVLNHLPPDLARAVLPLDDPNESLYARLAERTGVQAAGGRRVVEAVAADRRLAGLLEVAVGSPLVYVESVTWDRNLRPFDCYQSWLRSDRMRIDVSVASSPVVAAFSAPTTVGALG
jgi:GntR family transcriptional regulator